MADPKCLNAWLDTFEAEDGSTWPLPRDVRAGPLEEQGSRHAMIARMKVDANNGNRDAVESLQVIALAYLELLSITETRRRKIVRAIQDAKGMKGRT